MYNRKTTFAHLVDTKARDGANDMTPANLIADNTDIFYIVQPANVELEIQNFVGYVEAADADAYIELVKEDDTILCRLKITSTGHKSAVEDDSDTAQTFPIRVAPQSTTAAKLLKLRTSAALDGDTKVLCQLTVSGLD